MASLQTADQVEVRRHRGRDGPDFGWNYGAAVWLRLPVATPWEMPRAIIRRRGIIQRKAEIAEKPAYFALPWRPPSKADEFQDPDGNRVERGPAPSVPSVADFSAADTVGQSVRQPGATDKYLFLFVFWFRIPIRQLPATVGKIC